VLGLVREMVAAYAFGAGLFFVGYAIFEIPSNLLLHKVGARWWLARIMVSWGIIAAAFMFVQGPMSFYILRFLLGVAEAGFFPGIILYLTYWFPNDRRAKASHDRQSPHVGDERVVAEGDATLRKEHIRISAFDNL